MQTKITTFGLIALAAATFVTPAVSQTLSIGPNGVRVMEDRPQPIERRERAGRPDRMDRRAPDRRAEVSEREAVRIARGEGLREVDDVRRTRNTYRISGVDRRGDDIRVDVDRMSGAVIAVR